MSLIREIIQGTVDALFKWSPEIYQPCHVVRVPEKRGWPWNKKILVHTDFEGNFTIEECAPKDKFEELTFSPALPPADDDLPQIGFRTPKG